MIKQKIIFDCSWFTRIQFLLTFYWFTPQYWAHSFLYLTVHWLSFVLHFSCPQSLFFQMWYWAQNNVFAFTVLTWYDFAWFDMKSLAHWFASLPFTEDQRDFGDDYGRLMLSTWTWCRDVPDARWGSFPWVITHWYRRE